MHINLGGIVYPVRLIQKCDAATLTRLLPEAYKRFEELAKQEGVRQARSPKVAGRHYQPKIAGVPDGGKHYAQTWQKFLQLDGGTALLQAIKGNFYITITGGTQEGILCRPASLQNPWGWTSPFVDQQGNPAPLGFPALFNAANSDILLPTDAKVANSLLKVKSRASSLVVGNIATFTQKADGTYYVVTFNGPPSNWCYNCDRFGDIYQAQLCSPYGVPPIPPDLPTQFVKSWDGVQWVTDLFPWVSVEGSKIRTPYPVLAAKIVDVTSGSPPVTSKTLFIICLQSAGNFNAQTGDELIVYSTKSFTAKPTWSLLCSIANPMGDSWVTGGKYINDTFSFTPPAGQLCFYSRPEFNADCSEASFVVAAYRVNDTSITAYTADTAFGPAGTAFYAIPGIDFPSSQRYIAKLTTAGAYRITRYDGMGVFTPPALSWAATLPPYVPNEDGSVTVVTGGTSGYGWTWSALEYVYYDSANSLAMVTINYDDFMDLSTVTSRTDYPIDSGIPPLIETLYTGTGCSMSASLYSPGKPNLPTLSLPLGYPASTTNPSGTHLTIHVISYMDAKNGMTLAVEGTDLTGHNNGASLTIGAASMATLTGNANNYDPLNTYPAGGVDDPRYGCAVFSGMCFNGTRPLNWVSSGDLGSITGVATYAPDDTIVTYYPLNSF